jgi:hypothetical protein
MDHIPAMLLGATFVLIGVLGSALADRIRGLRVTARRDLQPQRETLKQPQKAGSPVHDGRQRARVQNEFDRRIAIPVVHTVLDTSSEDVVALLVSSGYAKPLAMKAVASCSAQERATQEQWVVAALRRVAGGAS